MIDGEATLRRLMAPLAPALARPDTREVVVNTPGRFGVEGDDGWTWHEAPELTFDRLEAIGILAAGFTHQDVGAGRPSCSSRLPDGERITVAVPPMMPAGTVGLTIRKRATSFTPTLGWLADRGYFSFLPPVPGGWPDRLARWVEEKRTIEVTAPTGAGKTTLLEALVRAVPQDEILITLESTPELMGLPHPGWRPLLYSQDEDGRGWRTAEQCVQDALRMRPDRIIFGETRTGETWGYLRALASGHPGGLSTTHAAPGVEGMLGALSKQIRQNPRAAGQSDAEIRADLRQHINVVISVEKRSGDPVPFRALSVEEVA